MSEQILESAKERIRIITNSRSLQDAKVEYLGKSSQINQEMKKLGKATPEERKELGQKINKIKQAIQSMLDEQAMIVEKAELRQRFENENLDLTTPARPRLNGSIHPITQCLEELIQVFSKYGFYIKDGPSI